MSKIIRLNFACFLTLLFAISYSCYSQSLVQITPDTATQGQYLKITIKGSNTSFSSISNPNIVFFVKDYDLKIFADSLNITNDTLMYGYFQIPYSFSGSFDLYINASVFLKLTNALFIKTQSIIPEIVLIDPDSAYQGDNFTFRIYGKNTHFQNCSYFRVWLLYAYADAVAVINDTLVEVVKQIPFSISQGKYGLKIENSIDGIILKSMVLTIMKSPFAPEVTGITPDSAEQGQTVKTLITAKNTYFTTSQVQYISIWQGNYGIYCDSYKIINDTAIYAWFTPVYSSFSGFYDLKVKRNPDEVLLLEKCFKVIAASDPPSIMSVTPDSAMQNETVTIQIKGYNTHFTYLNRKPGLRLKLNSYYIAFSTKSVINDSLFYAEAKIPIDAPAGIYDALVSDSMDGNMVLIKTFKIIRKPNSPEIILALPDTFTKGSSISLRIFCRNTHFTKTDQPIIALENKYSGTLFYPNQYEIPNDTIIFGLINQSSLSEKPVGCYDLSLGSLVEGVFSQMSTIKILHGDLTPQIKYLLPNKFLSGNTYTIDIYGKNTKFTKASYQTVLLYYGYSDQKIPTAFNVVNDTHIKATFTFPLYFYLGWASVEVYDSGKKALTYPVEFIPASYEPQITAVTPSFCKIGDQRTITIHTKNTQLTQYPQYQSALLIRNMGRDTIFGTNYQVLNDTTATVDFQPSSDNYPGDFDVIIKYWNLRQYKGMKLTRFSGTAKIQSVEPDSAFLDHEAEILVACKGTKFSKDVIIFPVFTSPSGAYLYADSTIIFNDSVLYVKLSIPQKAEKGNWDLTLLTDQEGDFHLKGKFKIDDKVSVAELAENSLKVFPNPFGGQLNIQSDGPIHRVELIDLTGSSIFSDEVDNLNYFTINTENLNSGIYLLKLVNDELVICKMITKF